MLKKIIPSIILYSLIVFLFLYHSFKLYNVYLGIDFMASENVLSTLSTTFNERLIIKVQSIFRVLILVSLAFILIVKNKKIGIIGMWLGIGLLVLSQFWLVSKSTDQLFLSMFSGLKPLKGFLLPTIITILYLKRK
ncbi:hypothetical protein [Lutibacter sp.]|uniref:hypothetical protein n=1 Tax=Lutibacter sp. TaxID=1925666 RepID=UPI0035661EC0